jgi:ribokinase
MGPDVDSVADRPSSALRDCDVLVFGSTNADVVLKVPHRPAGGETILATEFALRSGGKGANQAVAASRLGASVRFLGAVGEDDFSSLVRRSLEQSGVDISAVRTVAAPTGTAVVALTPDGENSIMVAAGANGLIDGAMTTEFEHHLSSAKLLVVQLEVPTQQVEQFVRRAADVGVRVVLNAAPALAIATDVLAVADPLIVNEHEAQTILQSALGAILDVDFSDGSAVAAALLELGPRSVVVTLGGRGAVLATAQTAAAPIVEPAHAVDVVDTTGAGDSFVGAIAARIAAGANLADALRYATAVAALAVGRDGAQDSYPDRVEVDAFLAGRTVLR